MPDSLPSADDLFPQAKQPAAALPSAADLFPPPAATERVAPAWPTSLPVQPAVSEAPAAPPLRAAEPAAVTPSSILAQTSPQAEAPVAPLATGTNFEQARRDLNLSPQEQNLYQHHLANLAGNGKVVQPNGDISTILQQSVERDGRTYNVPTVWDGKQLPPSDATARAAAAGWDKWPSYGTREEAEIRYGFMHDYMNQDVEGYLAANAPPQKPTAPPSPILSNRVASGLGMAGPQQRVVGAMWRGAAEAAQGAFGPEGLPSVAELITPQSQKEVDAALRAAEMGKYSPEAASGAVSLRQLGVALEIPIKTFLGAVSAVWGGASGAAQQMLQEAGLSEQNAGAVVEGANVVGAHVMASVPEIPIGTASGLGWRGRILPKQVGEGEVIPPVRRQRAGLEAPPAPIEGEAKPITTPPAPGAGPAGAPPPAPTGAPPGGAPAPTPGAARPVRPTRPEPQMPDMGMGTQELLDELDRVDGAGTRDKPIDVRSPGDLAIAQQNANPEPTEGQIEAGNYRKGHLTFQGLPVTIETPAGAERRGVGPNGEPWSVVLAHPYGYVKGTEGADGEHVDTYIGPHPESQTAFVIDQIDPRTRTFDEHKAVLGATTPDEAAAIYDAGFSDGSGASRRQSITPMPIPEFKEWLKAGETDLPAQAKPDAQEPQAPQGTTGRLRGVPVVRTPANILDFLASIGGVQDPTGELRGMDLHKPNLGFQPGFGPLIRPTGHLPDYAREAAEEAGWLPEDSTLADYYEAIDNAIWGRGQPHGAQPYGGPMGRIEPVVDEAREEHEIARRAAELGIAPHPDATTEEILAQIAEREAIQMEGEGAEQHDAHRDALERDIDARLPHSLPEAQDDIPGFERPASPLPGEARAVAPPPTRPPTLGGQPETIAGQAPGGQGAGAGAAGGGPGGAEGIGAPGARTLTVDEAFPVEQPERPVDAHKNPIFRVGERVVIPSDQGEVAGRRGVVTEANGIVMQAVFGGKKEAPFYTYTVRTDQGYETAANKLAAETERPAAAPVPDPLWHGKPVTPQSLKRGIGYDLQSANQARAASVRAIKPENKRLRAEEAKRHEADAVAKRDVLDAWRSAHPDEAARVLGEKPGERPTEEGRPVAAAETAPGVPRETPSATDMVIAETTHAKGGYPLFVVTMKDRVSPDRFNALRTAAKGGGGWYSSFRGRGAIPGFQFKDRAAAEKFVAENGTAAPPVAPPAQAPIIAPAEEAPHGPPHELQEPVPPRAPGERPEAVHGAAPVEPAGPVREPEGTRGPGVAKPTHGGTPEGRSGAGGQTGGGGAGVRNAPGLPAAGARPEPGAAGRPGGAKPPDANLKGKNFVIEPGATEEQRGFPQKARDNLAAIDLAKRLTAEKRPATLAEQQQLVKYVGWGGLRGAFDTGQGFRKGFEDIGRRLKEILTPDEYTTAARSTQYAHYTAEHVIRSMWDAVQRMGFGGGNVIEPGMGIGHFLGMSPSDLEQRMAYQGLELDHLTADIAKLLYPESGVRQADFTRTPIPEGAFDLAIGNPPFSDVVIRSDPKYAARGFMLHDYFFAKSLDSIRPGGLMAYVTSAGTMNKLDPSARRYLAERADFIGGVRLPSTAFARNAGTEVTTDILFFRRSPGVTPIEEGKEPDWAQTVVRTLPNKEGVPTEGNVSRYFSEHPEMVLGEEGFFDKLYQGRYAVRGRPDQDLAADLRAAIERLPRDVMRPEPTPEERRPSTSRRRSGRTAVSTSRRAAG